MLRKSVKICYTGELPGSVLINGIPFSRDGTKNLYQSTKEWNNDFGENIIYVQVLPKRDLQKSLPSQIKVDGRVFVLRFGPFFTPKNPTERQVGKFFDSIAFVYEQVILPTLNKQVIHYLLKSIIGKKTNLVNRPRVLDFGIGSGISADVAKKKFRSIPLDLYGLEVSDNMIKICKDKGIEVKKKISPKIPYPNDYFDGAILSFVTGYFASLLDFTENFSEILRILKPLGVIAFNLHRTEWSSMNSYQHCLSQIGFFANSPKIQITKIGKTNYRIVILEAQKSC